MVLDLWQYGNEVCRLVIEILIFKLYKDTGMIPGSLASFLLTMGARRVDGLDLTAAGGPLFLANIVGYGILDLSASRAICSSQGCRLPSQLSGPYIPMLLYFFTLNSNRCSNGV